MKVRHTQAGPGHQGEPDMTAGTTPDTAAAVAILQALARRMAVEQPHRRGDDPAYRDGWRDARQVCTSFVHSAVLVAVADLALPEPRPASSPPCLTVLEGDVMTATSIEWATHVWNPTTGCDQVSPGCDNCYALTMARRLKGMGAAKYQNDGDPKTSGPGFGITEHPDAITLPLRWRKPRRVFVNSMSDLFHARVSDEFITLVWAVMAATPQHTYQILTKRHGRMRSLLNSDRFRGNVSDEVTASLDLTSDAALQVLQMGWPLSNVWLGVSVDDQKRADLRIPALLGTPAAVRFLSCEPLLGPVDLECVDWDDATGLTVLEHPPNGIDWVIVGGESGRGARPMHPDWARQLRDQCAAGGVPFFFKQWGESAPLGQLPDEAAADWEIRNGVGYPAETFCRVGKHAAGRELDGRTWDEYPAAIR